MNCTEETKCVPPEGCYCGGEGCYCGGYCGNKMICDDDEPVGYSGEERR